MKRMKVGGFTSRWKKEWKQEEVRFWTEGRRKQAKGREWEGRRLWKEIAFRMDGE